MKRDLAGVSKRLVAGMLVAVAVVGVAALAIHAPSQNAGRSAADPTAGEDVNSRKSHGSLAVWLLPPIVQLRGPCRQSTHE